MSLVGSDLNTNNPLERIILHRTPQGFVMHQDFVPIRDDSSRLRRSEICKQPLNVASYLVDFKV
jgi:hypothetical protein